MRGMRRGVGIVASVWYVCWCESPSEREDELRTLADWSVLTGCELQLPSEGARDDHGGCDRGVEDHENG